jgi:DNA-binding CsgD family transcriptional regulator
MFTDETRERCLAVTGRDPEVSYRELLLDIRVSGPAFHRLVRTLGLSEDSPMLTARVNQVRNGVMRERKPRRAALLTARERETLTWVANGFSYREVGEKMFLSEETVKYYMKSCIRRLGARNRTHAATIALAFGFLGEGE